MKKSFSLFLAALFLAALLTGCSNAQTHGDAWQETSTVPQTNESLTVFCMDGLKDSSMIKLALKQYQALYPDTQVELLMPGSAIDYEIYQQVAAQVMAGEGPDVFIINDTVMDVEKLVRQGIFADMEPFFRQTILIGVPITRPSWTAACGTGSVLQSHWAMTSHCLSPPGRLWRKPALT